MVRTLAWQLKRKVPSRIDEEELISEGQVGLLRAARDFDPTRGAAFATYAYWRIRGSMLDWIRSQNWYQPGDFHSGKLAEGVETEADGSVAMIPTGNAAGEFEDTKASDPATEASQNEVREVLRGLISRLEGLPRQILSATVLQSQTLEDAGRAIGVHKGTAQRAQVRGFAELATAIRKQGLAELDGEELRHLVFKNVPAGKTGRSDRS
jgi:RNA polymerase sigma factor (sigma-70 family)